MSDADREAEIRLKQSGRTRYEGQQESADELLCRLLDATRAELKELRTALHLIYTREKTIYDDVVAERDALKAALDEAGRIATSALTCPDYDEPTDAANAYATALARILERKEKASG